DYSRNLKESLKRLGGARNNVLSLDRTRIHNDRRECSGNERNLVRGRIIAGYFKKSPILVRLLQYFLKY
ncbi:hypothetical protein, partial [Acinetobacter sp.]|uniref:hypothetical protein n=1 Tax=Acinetobacter sp. TaxID=472 RepID=UPI0035AF0B50